MEFQLPLFQLVQLYDYNISQEVECSQKTFLELHELLELQVLLQVMPDEQKISLYEKMKYLYLENFDIQRIQPEFTMQHFLL